MADEAPIMNAEAFRAWRQSLGWKQKDAAERLGLKKRMIQYYEKGDRNGKSVEIPKSVRLACYALAEGIADFDGEKAEFAKPRKKKKSKSKPNGADDPTEAPTTD